MCTLRKAAPTACSRGMESALYIGFVIILMRTKKERFIHFRLSFKYRGGVFIIKNSNLKEEVESMPLPILSSQ